MAGGAALSLVDGARPQAQRRVTVLDQTRLVQLVGLATVLTHLAGEALGDDHADRRRDQERRHPHVLEARDRLGGAVRVERAQHEVARQRGPNGDLGGLLVTHLTDQDHVGVVAQE